MSDEHFLLTSYPLQAQQPALSTVSYAKQPKEDQRLCVVASGVGLSVFDLKDQTPLSSITLGPSFLPTTAPVSRSSPTVSPDSIRVKGIRKTWVGVGAATGGEVLCWSEEERKDGSTEGEAKKVTYPLSEVPVQLAAPRTLSNHLIVLSASGALSLASEADLSPLASLPSTSAVPSSQKFQLYTIAASTSSFLPPAVLALIPVSSRAHLILVVRSFANEAAAASMVEISQKKFKKTKRPSSAAVIEEVENIEGGASGSTTEIEVVLVDPEVISEDGSASGQIMSLGKTRVAGAQVGISEDGFVSALGPNGTLESYRLAFSASASFAPTYAELYTSSTSASLTLSPIRSLPLSTTALAAATTTILSLHSSFVLLASVRPPKPNLINTTGEEALTKVVALVWDVRLGAIVSANSIAISTTAFPASTTPSRHLVLSLASLSLRTASLVVSPSAAPGRSVVFILPLILPSASVLAAVVGKHLLTAKYSAQGDTVVEQAAKREPMRHPRTSKGKLVLLEASEVARAKILATLESTLSVLESGKGATVDAAIAKAEKAFSVFLGNEKDRLREYTLTKMRAAEEKEKERRIAALQEKERLQTSTKKYRTMKRRIELAIKEVGDDRSWTEVTGKRIKGVSDMYRYKYYEERQKLDQETGDIVVEQRGQREQKALDALEPTLPSSFVTAVLRLCFPGPLDSELDFASSSASSKVWKHPTGVIGYLLKRGLVGDSVMQGGVVNYLARAGDWPNIHQALLTMPDIPEASTVALLKVVAAHHATLTPESIMLDSETLPFPIPALATFLTGFVASPTTPATLRIALQQQLTADEAMPVLEVLDGWLGWWAARGGGGGSLAAESKDVKSKRLPTNPFLVLSQAVEDSPPRVEDIVHLVQAILDSHFVSLLLLRQSHSLLRRLSQQVSTHVALSSDLSSLLGALAIYARAKEDQTSLYVGGKRVAKKVVDEKSLGQSMAARVEAQEKHVAVKAYSVEKWFM